MVGPHSDDLSLVLACRRGERRAFTLLMERHQARAHAIARGYLRDPEDSLEIVQEAFVRVYRRLETFDGASSFSTWFFRIVTNLSIDQLRRRRHRRAIAYDDSVRAAGPGVGAATAIAGLVGSFGDPADMLRRREIRDAFHDALDHLSVKHRDVMVLRELEGLSHEEIARRTGCARGTIMSRLFYARRTMQGLLAARLDLHASPATVGESELVDERGG